MRLPRARMRFNFNFFNMSKLVQCVCVKLLWHDDLLLRLCLVVVKRFSAENGAFFPFHYGTIGVGITESSLILPDTWEQEIKSDTMRRKSKAYCCFPWSYSYCSKL